MWLMNWCKLINKSRDGPQLFVCFVMLLNYLQQTWKNHKDHFWEFTEKQSETWYSKTKVEKKSSVKLSFNHYNVLILKWHSNTSIQDYYKKSIKFLKVIIWEKVPAKPFKIIYIFNKLMTWMKSCMNSILGNDFSTMIPSIQTRSPHQNCWSVKTMITLFVKSMNFSKNPSSMQCNSVRRKFKKILSNEKHTIFLNI